MAWTLDPRVKFEVLSDENVSALTGADVNPSWAKERGFYESITLGRDWFGRFRDVHLFFSSGPLW
jgi:hypothetical protein